MQNCGAADWLSDLQLGQSGQIVPCDHRSHEYSPFCKVSNQYGQPAGFKVSHVVYVALWSQ